MFNYPRISFLHEETKKEVIIPFDDQEWPESWKTVEFKEYPRMAKFKLPEPIASDISFHDILQNRKSRRGFDNAKSLSSEELSSLLFWSVGIRDNKEHPEKSFRFHPSGGARYPLEVYFYFRGNNEIPEGFYHYNIKLHLLELLPIVNPRERIESLKTYPFVYDAAIIFFITAYFERSMRKYRERGYRFTLLEGGIIFHNFYLVAESLSLNYCGVGTHFDNEVWQLLELAEDEEFIVSIVAGH